MLVKKVKIWAYCERAGRTVGEGSAVYEEADENDPRMKYFRAASPDAGPAMMIAGQRVERDRQHFEAQKKAYQPGRLRHQDGTGRAEHHQHVRFGAVQVFPDQVPVGDQGPENGGRPEQDDEEGAEVVVDNLAGQGDRNMGRVVQVHPLDEAVDNGGHTGKYRQPGPQSRVAAFRQYGDQ